MTTKPVRTADGIAPATDHSPDLADLLSPYFEGLAVELVIAAGFDSAGRLVSFVGEEGTASANRHVLACVRAALGPPSVVGLLLAHNHPYGPASPSPEDIATTRHVAALCRLAGVRLLDHLIHAPGGVASMRALGLLH